MAASITRDPFVLILAGFAKASTNIAIATILIAAKDMVWKR